MEQKKFSFLEYLNNRGLYYKTSTIEEFLLTLKLDNVILLNGISGLGKTSLIEQYIKYINLNNHFNKNIKSTFKIGKTTTSKGFVVKRINAYQLFPHMKYEDECYGVVNDIKIKGRLNILPRFFFKPQENEEFMNFLEKEAEVGTENLDFELILDDPISNNYLLFNAENSHKEDQTVKSFIENCESEKAIPHFLIFYNINNDNIDNVLFKRKDLPNNLNIVYTGLLDNIKKYVQDFSIINFTTCNPLDYLQNNLNNVTLSNLDYLEDYSNERMYNINDIINSIQKIHIQNNKSLYNILIDELNSLYYILKENNIGISNQFINEILNYVIIGWKYEDKPEIFDNWKKYYDTQLSQRIIPLIQKNLSEELLNKLITYCNNDYNYYRSYNILINMKKIL